MTIVTKGMGAILKSVIGKFKKGQKVREIKYPKDSTKHMRKTYLL